jgi:hypothetical protein
MKLADELGEITNLSLNGADFKSAPALNQICTSVVQICTSARSNLNQPWLSPRFLCIISSNAAATGLSILPFLQ